MLTEVCFSSPVDLVAAIAQRRLSSGEVVQAHLEQIETYIPSEVKVCLLVCSW